MNCIGQSIRVEKTKTTKQNVIIIFLALFTIGFGKNNGITFKSETT